MEFISEITGMVNTGTALSLAFGAAIIVASMAFAVLAWRSAARKVNRLERAVAELEAAQSRRIARLEGQLPELRQKLPDGSKDSKAAISPFLTSLSASDKPGERSREPEFSNIVPLHAARTGKKKGADRFTAENIRAAINDGRLEAWYQPVVGLPGRLPRYYECHLMLKDDNGKHLVQEEWYSPVLRCQIGGEVARFALVECFALARKLRREKRDGAVIWPVCADDFGNAHETERMMALLTANTSLKSRFLAGVRIAEYDNASEDFENRLHELKEMGFNLALTGGRNLEQAQKTVETGLFSLLMLPCQTVLSNSFERGVSIASRLHAADPARRIEIAATGIDMEETAVELIDCDVLLAQGKLFSTPRPLRKNTRSSGGAASGA